VFSASPHQITLGERIQIQASSPSADLAGLSVSANGQPIALADGQAGYTPTQGGIVLIRAEAIDHNGNLSQAEQAVRVIDPADETPPVVAFDSPADLAEITAPTDIHASVQDASLASWRLLLLHQDGGHSVLAQGDQPLSNQAIYRFDPSQLLNGIHRLALVAEDANGQQNAAQLTLVVEGELKVGQFALSFEDLNLPVAGIPITVTRTYDTRQRHQSLDFGQGWSVDYQSLRLQESGRAGFAWQIYESGGGLNVQRCIQSNGDRMVSITLPDGQVEKFLAKAEPECRSAFDPYTDVTLVYEAQPGTFSSLEQTDYGLLRPVNGHLVDLGDPGAPVDPQNYKLTSREGVVYYLDQGFGIRRIIEPSGNQISFTDQGITHSNGLSVTFQRDAQGRITQVTGPDGAELHYQYDAQGNLTQVTDPSGQHTRFRYLGQHYLSEIIDPRGVSAVRYEYDDDGRLIAQIDAHGDVQGCTNVAGTWMYRSDPEGLD